MHYCPLCHNATHVCTLSIRSLGIELCYIKYVWAPQRAAGTADLCWVHQSGPLMDIEDCKKSWASWIALNTCDRVVFKLFNKKRSTVCSYCRKLRKEKKRKPWPHAKRYVFVEKRPNKRLLIWPFFKKKKKILFSMRIKSLFCLLNFLIIIIHEPQTRAIIYCSDCLRFWYLLGFDIWWNCTFFSFQPISGSSFYQGRPNIATENQIKRYAVQTLLKDGIEPNGTNINTWQAQTSDRQPSEGGAAHYARSPCWPRPPSHHGFPVLFVITTGAGSEQQPLRRARITLPNSCVLNWFAAPMTSSGGQA